MNKPSKLFIDLTGQSFGLLTVLSRTKNKAGRAYWYCKCSCGNFTEASGKDLRSGHKASCGCLFQKRNVETKTKHGLLSKNGKATKEYWAWKNMKQRCLNPKTSQWEDYGGRGITVCERWLESFENFLADVGYAPSPKHSIDRIDVNGDYEPSNVRWATALEQILNTRNSKTVIYRGVTYPSVKALATHYGIDHRLIYAERSATGISVQDSLGKRLAKRN